MKLIFTLMFSAFVTICFSQDYKTIGASFDYSSPLDLSEVINTPSEQFVSVKAKVNSVCQVKGCWMTLTSSNVEEDVFVKFKDYGFFMPLDLAGQEIIAHGVVSKTTTSVDELRHYAKDAGKSKEVIEAITEPKEEYKMMADGVVILD
tara:strand:+ start:794 stop:1237 length:444 start_codon:yes stop_codon:yes gene_type:complete